MRAISFMHQAKIHVRHSNDIFITPPPARAFNESILQALDALTKAIESDNANVKPIYIPKLN